MQVSTTAQRPGHHALDLPNTIRATAEVVCTTSISAMTSPTALEILPDVMATIGQTPLVRINSINKKAHLECELLAKYEFFNACGSGKDRIGKRMVEDAEMAGHIKPGDTLIEPTYWLGACVRNQGLPLHPHVTGSFSRVVCSIDVDVYISSSVIAEKMSLEKVNVLKALGAEIIRTPTEAAWNSPESHIGIAKRLVAELPNAHMLDQYTNPSNPLAHYDGTAEEILNQCDGKVDMAVIGVGTGGTISGIAKKLKGKCPSVIIVGVDPVGSILAQPESMNDTNCLKPYKVEGIGYDFVPDVLDRSLIDMWVKTDDQESFIMARRLIREEGLLCGGSSGSAMAAAVRAAATLGAGQRCVVILPDSTRNYMSKFLNDTWMYTNKFVANTVHTRENYSKYRKETGTWWSAQRVSVLDLPHPSTVPPHLSCAAAIETMERRGYDQLPVVTENGKVQGVVTIGNLLSMLSSGRVVRSDSVEAVLFGNFSRVTHDSSLAELATIFDKDYFAVVTSMDGTIAGLATRIDLLNYITSADQASVEQI
ncbi:hypothetical protein PsorP6_017636 [Peronosclerospora sorghi]|uniref:Uncharacterized protein n=1 Tax=Peronosclerospora sorghi TaxID=230839 RepID=A0ACC0WKB4_9STRA|nr:hypothetical protein PsorP6_017636 [Peronosclerospora sorghi]